MDQPTFSDLEHQSKKRETRREGFLEQMDSLIPWQRLEGRIRPHYPRPGRGAGFMPCPSFNRHKNIRCTWAVDLDATGVK